MRRIIAVFFSVCLVATAAVAAPRGRAYIPRTVTLAELVRLNEESIQKDVTGNAPVCKGCATPGQFLTTLREQNHRSLPPSASWLPNYLRTLEERPLVGEFWLACLDRATGKPIAHCNRRTAAKGEKGAFDPATGRLVFRLGCSNPAEQEVKERCARIRYETDSSVDTSVRFTYCGPAPVESDCWGVQEAGETEIERWWSDKCPITGCNFSAIEAELKERCWTVGSHEVTTSGQNYLYVPASFAEKGSVYRTVLCLDRGSMHSDAIGVQGFDYQYRSSRREPEARVWYDRTLVPERAPKLYWPWGEWGQ